MDATAITIMSGIILLAVFALAGWVSKRRRDRRHGGHGTSDSDHPDDKGV